MRSHIGNLPVVIVYNYLEVYQKFLRRAKNPNTLFDRRFNGDQALFWLGDDKLVITPVPIQNANYLCEKWGYQKTFNISPNEFTAIISDDILSSSEIIKRIIAHAGSERKIALIPYASTKEFFHLAHILEKEHHLKVLLPESPKSENLWVRDYLDTKVGFRTIASQCLKQDQYPMGFVSMDSNNSADIAAWFKGKGRGCVVKSNSGGSGVGNLFLPFEEMSDKEAIIQKMTGNEYLKNDIFVVEDYINATKMISPSVEAYIPEKSSGRPKITYLCEQQFEESGRFSGVSISKELETRPWHDPFIENSLNIFQKMQDMGYVGYCDIDAVVDDKDKLHFLEVNSRRTGGTYVHEFLVFILGENYWETTSILSQNKLSIGKARSLEELEDLIAGIIYPIGSAKKGVMPLLNSALVQGFFGVIILADTLDETIDLKKQLINRLKVN
jgi:hypothetical protein